MINYNLIITKDARKNNNDDDVLFLYFYIFICNIIKINIYLIEYFKI